MTALIGPNGSGKTTMLNMIGGFYTADAGRIVIGDTEVQKFSSHRVAREGVARTFQTPEHPRERHRARGGRVGSVHDRSGVDDLRDPAAAELPQVAKADIAEAERVLELVGMSHLRNEVATSLPLGMRRMLEVARAVIAEPRVLLLDEIASGMDRTNWCGCRC